MLTFSSIPSSQASPELLPEAYYGSSGTAGWPHRGSKTCILATEQAGTPGRSGRSGKGGEGGEFGLVTCHWNISLVSSQRRSRLITSRDEVPRHPELQLLLPARIHSLMGEGSSEAVRSPACSKAELKRDEINISTRSFLRANFRTMK